MVKEYYNGTKVLKTTKTTDLSKIGFNNKTKQYELISLMEKNGLKKYVSSFSDKINDVVYYWDIPAKSKVLVIYNHPFVFSQKTEITIENLKRSIIDLNTLLNSQHEITKHYLADMNSFYKTNSPNSILNMLQDLGAQNEFNFIQNNHSVNPNLVFGRINAVIKFKPSPSNSPEVNSQKKVDLLLNPLLQEFFRIYALCTNLYDNIYSRKESYETKLKTLSNVKTQPTRNSFIAYLKDLQEADSLGFILKPASIPIPIELRNQIHDDEIVFVHSSFIDSTNLVYKSINYNNRAINYNANKESSTFNTAIRDYYNPTNYFRNKINKNAFKLAKALKGLTFGIEIETSDGALPYERILDQIGLVPLKDGSISSYEYATVPLGFLYNNSKIGTTMVPNVLELSKDLQALWFSLSMLNQFTRANKFCSMHVHIGNTRKDKPFIVAFYLLCLMLQDEMFNYVPYFKLDAPRYIKAKKNYCKKLPNFNFDLKTLKKSDSVEDFNTNILEWYNTIFEFLSNGESLGPKYNRKAKIHPLGKKWERTERYNWINMVNTIFNSEETIEFRLHGGTTNPYKIFNWILICSAMIKFTENNIKEILAGEKFTLNQVIQGYSTNFRSKKRTNEFGVYIYEYLTAYLNERKEFFSSLKKAEDYAGNKEFSLDREYTFEFRGSKTPLISY